MKGTSETERVIVSAIEGLRSFVRMMEFHKKTPITAANITKMVKIMENATIRHLVEWENVQKWACRQSISMITDSIECISVVKAPTIIVCRVMETHRQSPRMVAGYQPAGARTIEIPYRISLIFPLSKKELNSYCADLPDEEWLDNGHLLLMAWRVPHRADVQWVTPNFMAFFPENRKSFLEYGKRQDIMEGINRIQNIISENSEASSGGILECLSPFPYYFIPFAPEIIHACCTAIGRDRFFADSLMDINSEVLSTLYFFGSLEEIVGEVWHNISD